MRADLLDRISTLEEEAAREAAVDKSENRDPVAPGIARQIQALEQELADSEVEFTFQALGRRAYAALVTGNPPTEAQKTQAEAQGVPLTYNSDTFPPLLLTASCVAPEGTTLEDMTDLWDNWSDGQLGPMWRACLTANMGSADVGPKSLIASAILGVSGPS